jgi:hypothetical protein
MDSKAKLVKLILSISLTLKEKLYKKDLVFVSLLP